MLASLRQRLDRDDDGFTLIELMVVVLIIAILIAIAIPTFLGVQDRAKDRSAQSNLRNALTAAKTIATDDAGEFDTVTAEADGTLEAVEPAFTYILSGTAPTGPSQITVQGAAADYVLLYTKSDSGTFFGIAANKDGLVGYCKGAGPAVTNAATLAGCNDPKW